MQSARKVRNILVWCLFGLLTFCVLPLSAVDEYELDLEFLRLLSEMDFMDYAQMQVAQLEKKYPEQKDSVNLEKARIYYSTGKSKLAEEALKAIPANSKLKDDVTLLKAQVFAARRNWAEADKLYRAYFAANKKPVSNRRVDKDNFVLAVKIYNNVLKELNKPAEANNILELLKSIKGAVSERQLQFLKLQDAIAVEEAKLLKGQPVNVGALQGLQQQLAEMQFIRDGVGASAALQIARIQTIIGRHKLLPLMAGGVPGIATNAPKIAAIKDFAEAVKTVNMITPFLEELEKNVGTGDQAHSPLAEAMFRKAAAFASHSVVTYAIGLSAKDKDGKPKQDSKILEKSQNQVRGAAKYFEQLLNEYPGSPYEQQALAEHNACSKFSEAAFGMALSMAGGGNAAKVGEDLDKARAFLQQKNFKEAYPLCLDALRLARASKKLPEVAGLLILCLTDRDDLNGAAALLDYLKDVAPKAEGTADTALRFGAAVRAKALAEKNPSVKDDLMNRAMSAWDNFVDVAPAHPSAPDVAFAVAENEWQNAQKYVDLSRKASQPEEKAKLQAEAKAVFARALPKYQRLVNVFSAFDKGTRALYKLGWIYDILDQPTEAIDCFNGYYEAEDNPKFAEDKLNGRFRAGLLTMQGEHPEEAIPVFTELSDAIGQGVEGVSKSSKVATDILENCACYQGWAADCAGEKFTPVLNVSARRTRELQSRIDGFRARQEEGKKLRQKNDEEKKAGDADLEENVIRTVKSMADMDLAKLGKERAYRQSTEDVTKMSEAEKTVYEQAMQEAIRKQTAELLISRKNEVFGDQEALKARQEAVDKAQADCESALEAAKKDIATKGQEADDMAKLATSRKQEADKLRARMVETEKELNLADAERQLAQNAVAEAESAVDSSQDKQRSAKQKELDKANKALEEISARFDAASKANREASSEEVKNKITELENGQRQALEAASALRLEAKLQKAKLIVAEKALAIVEAEKQAIAKRMKFNALCGELLALEDEPRLARQAEADKACEESLTAERAYNAARHARLDAMNEVSLAEEKELEKEIAELQKLKDAEEASVADSRREFLAWKQKAVENFLGFLQKYPQSDKVPDVLARLGSIYLLDIQNSAKASEYLTRLTKDYPKAPAARKAMFQLGKARAEEGKMGEAAAAFEKYLSNPAEEPTANLLHILGISLDAKVPGPVLAAGKELLKRAEADKQTAIPVARVLYSLGVASLQDKKYNDCVNYLEKLLADYPRTAYYFDAKFALAEARGSTQTPDWDGLEKDLSDIRLNATDPAVVNKATCLYAEALQKSGDASKTASVLSCYQIVLLADPTIPANREWLERALYGAAKIYSAEGNREKTAETVKRYQELFSGGRFAAEMGKL